MTWDPDEYSAAVRMWIHDYDELQDQIALATTGVTALSILDLGVGAGETAKRVLERHPVARLIGIDSSAEMLRRAAEVLPPGRVTLAQQDLASPLPHQMFDLVVSALAVHHLEGDLKAKLFVDIGRHLNPGGNFVMGDVVLPDDPADALIENEPGYDFPSTIQDQLDWMGKAGFVASVVWTRQDLAVFNAKLSSTT